MFWARFGSGTRPGDDPRLAGLLSESPHASTQQDGLDAFSTGSRMKRIPQLDGLRAIAFLAVFLNHSIYVPMAWAGVDLFFVLSGFLITNILLSAKEKSTGHYYRDFYSRRVRRILPPYFMVLAAVALFLSQGINWPAIWWQFLLFVQNFSVAFERGVGVLNPYWSLAVEEQYYLLWPLLVYFVPRNQLKMACVFFLVAAPMARWVFTPHAQSYMVIFTLTPFRMDLLAAGSLLAIFWTEDRESVRRLLPWAWILMIVSGLLFFGPAIRLPWWRAKANSIPFNVAGYSLSTLFFATLLIVVLFSENRFVQGVLRNKALMWVGTVSYMCYLIHEPVLHVTIPALGKVGGTLAGFLVTLLISGVSWKYVERPILQHGQKPRGQAPATT